MYKFNIMLLLLLYRHAVHALHGGVRSAGHGGVRHLRQVRVLLLHRHHRLLVGYNTTFYSTVQYMAVACLQLFIEIEAAE